MIMPKSEIVQPLILPLLLLLIGCSGVGGPSNSDVEAAITQSIGERGISLKEIKIIEIGAAQGDGTGQCWPVKVHFSGKWQRGRQKSIRKEIVYNVTKDGFGVWKAKPEEMF